MARINSTVKFVHEDRRQNRRLVYVVYFAPEQTVPPEWFTIYEWRPAIYDTPEAMRVALERQRMGGPLLPVFVASQRTIPSTSD